MLLSCSFLSTSLEVSLIFIGQSILTQSGVHFNLPLNSGSNDFGDSWRNYILFKFHPLRSTVIKTF
nr:MAG TPA: hypothetical protein [Caudoviricetes sp.]